MTKFQFLFYFQIVNHLLRDAFTNDLYNRNMALFQNSYLLIEYSINLYDMKYCYMIAFMLFHALIERSISAGATCQLILKYLLAL